MKVVIFDPYAGAAGDMFIASLIDLGADKRYVRDRMEEIGDELGGIDIEIHAEERRGIFGTKVNVASEERERSYREIISMIESSSLNFEMKKDVLDILDIFIGAEASVHSLNKEEVFFHNLGSSDTIVDIVGAVSAFYNLKMNEKTVLSLPVSIGGGIIEMGHGRMSAPAPATLEILRRFNVPMKYGPVESELLTPTGASILSHFVDSFIRYYSNFRVEKIGYGFGSKDLDVINALKVLSGELEEDLLIEEICLLETNVDDVTGELLGYLTGELIEDGAMDVSIIPAVMKKGRIGSIIRVLCKKEDSLNLIHKIMRETGSLGVRYQPSLHRVIAKRSIERIPVEVGGRIREVSVKVATDGIGNVVNVSCEFDDAKRVAKESNLPIKDVIALVDNEALRRYKIKKW
jgi:TIGR00299 family protein